MDDSDAVLNESVGVDQSNNPNNPDEPTDLKISNKRSRSVSSSVWSYFNKLPDKGDRKGRAQCKACGKEYAGGGNKNGTSTLLRHMESCKKIPKGYDESEVGKLMLDHAGKLKARKVDQKAVRDIITMMLIEHDLPFSFVEYRRFRQLLKCLHPDVKVPSRRAATIDVINMYYSEKNKLKEVLNKVPSRICLTSDVWTSCTSEGYISLTAHFVDANWKLNSKILNFCHFPPPHFGTELAKTVYEFLEEWGIEGKKFSLTLDNASANDSMQNMLKERLLNNTNGLLCGGEFFHVRCCAHILNLIIQEGLKVTSGALNKIRESIKYVKGSEARMNAFKACVAKVGDIDTKVGLRLDVTTRWNSTFIMLESALAYRCAFSNLAFEDGNYKFCPTQEEWTRGEKMREFLHPFYLITELMSGSSYPTSNLYFTQVWKIECWLEENMSNEDEIIGNMAASMKVKFDKYWRDYIVVLALGTVLDPRYKFPFLQFCYSKIGLDAIACQAKLKVVKHKLYSLFNEYIRIYKKETTSSVGLIQERGPQESQPISSSSRGKASASQFGIVDEFIKYENENMPHEGNSELDTYLDEQKLSLAYHPNLDLLQYWKENQLRFPNLALMACDILSIQITTVASESAFSIGSRVLNKYRSSLLPENVQSLICTRNWLLGFGVEDEDENVVIGKKEEPTASRTESSIVIEDD